MFDICQRIKFFVVAVFIIGSQLETIEIFEIKNGLITIEMLQVRYLHFFCVDKSTNTYSVAELTPNFKIHIVENREFPFVKIHITPEYTIDAFIIFQLE